MGKDLRSRLLARILHILNKRETGVHNSYPVPTRRSLWKRRKKQTPKITRNSTIMCRFVRWSTSKMKMETDGFAIQKRIHIRISGNRDAGNVTKWRSRPAEGNSNTLGTAERRGWKDRSIGKWNEKSSWFKRDDSAIYPSETHRRIQKAAKRRDFGGNWDQSRFKKRNSECPEGLTLRSALRRQYKEFLLYSYQEIGE